MKSPFYVSPLFLLCLSLVFAGVDRSVLAAEDEVATFEQFKIVVPKGFKVTKKTPVHDFDLFIVSKGDKEYVTIYLGNHPNFPLIKKAADKDVKEFSANGVDMLSEWKGNAMIRKEIRIELKHNADWPQFVHAFSHELPGDQVVIADKILSSLVITDPGKKGK